MYINGRTFEILRTQVNLTRTQFAREIGCSHSLVSRVERGERGLSREMLERWLHYYGLDKSDFDGVKFAKQYKIGLGSMSENLTQTTEISTILQRKQKCIAN